jgi:hypothetical protein
MRLLELFDPKQISVGPENIDDAGSVADRPRHEHGTIVLLELTEDSAASIGEWCRDHGIPCIDGKSLHCTVLFSRKPVEHLCELDGKPVRILGRIKSWKKLGEALTLELEAPMACKLHEWMISQGGTHDYPEYIAHTTVSYEWPTDELPVDSPRMVMEFDRLVVKPIDPKYDNKSKSD